MPRRTPTISAGFGATMAVMMIQPTTLTAVRLASPAMTSRSEVISGSLVQRTVDHALLCNHEQGHRHRARVQPVAQARAAAQPRANQFGQRHSRDRRRRWRPRTPARAARPGPAGGCVFRAAPSFGAYFAVRQRHRARCPTIGSGFSGYPGVQPRTSRPLVTAHSPRQSERMGENHADMPSTHLKRPGEE